MEDRHTRAAARKKALKELLEGVAMIAIGVVARLLAGDFTFVEGATTRYEGRTYVYLMALAAAMLIIGAVLLVMGLVHLVKPGKGGEDNKQGR